jgi:hypothetical protein
MSRSAGRSRRRLVLALALLALVAAALAVLLRPAEHPRRDPTGELMPHVSGESLEGERVPLPPGRPAVLLLGYVQDAQFDADRWLFGLLQAGTPVLLLEVPTIPGLVPRLISGTIDTGMRSGIPREDWGSVVTVYGEGARELAAFTGDERPRNMRVLLVDAEGRVRWFHDRGFSASKLLELDRAARALVGEATAE